MADAGPDGVPDAARASTHTFLQTEETVPGPKAHGYIGEALGAESTTRPAR